MNYIHKKATREAELQNCVSDTSKNLSAALNGQIPVAALGSLPLDKVEVMLFLTRELNFWCAAAKGANFEFLAVLFDELQTALLKSVNDGMRKQGSGRSPRR